MCGQHKGLSLGSVIVPVQALKRDNLTVFQWTGPFCRANLPYLSSSLLVEHKVRFAVVGVGNGSAPQSCEKRSCLQRRTSIVQWDSNLNLKDDLLVISLDIKILQTSFFFTLCCVYGEVCHTAQSDPFHFLRLTVALDLIYTVLTYQYILAKSRRNKVLQIVVIRFPNENKTNLD